MVESRTKNVSRNIIWGVLNKTVSLGLPFVTRTVMIYTLGMRYVGIGSLFSSILQVLSFAELGIGSAIVFSMYRPIAEENDKKVCALLNFYKKTYRIIGLVILVFGLSIMPFLKYFIASGLPDGINLQLLFAIYLLNSVLGYFLFAYKQSIFAASQRVDLISKIGLVFQLISSIAQIVILLTVGNYYLFVLVIPIITCLNNICVGILFDKYYSKYKCIGIIEDDERKSIQKKVGGLIFQKIGSIVLSSVDTIVISSFLGLIPLALYQNYYYVITALFGFLSVIMQSMIAGVGNSIAIESIEKNYNDFKKFNFAYIWIVSWFACCLLCLYQPFIKLWVGEKNMLGMEMVSLFTVYFFVHKWCDMLFVYQEACGLWWETKFVPLMAAIINLVVNIVLVQVIGLPGILISTIISVVLVYETGYARVLFSTYFKSIKRGLGRYWIRQIIYLLSSIIVSFSTFMICKTIRFKTALIELIVYGIICIIFPNCLFVFISRRIPEFQYARLFLKKIKRIVSK